MRVLALLPIALLAAAGLGYGTCLAAGINPATRELVWATGICLGGSLLAAVPLVLTRGMSQFAVSQGALVGSMLHLMTIIALGASVYLKLKPGQQFIYWLMLMYGTSLVVFVACAVHAVKVAPPETAKTPQKPGK